MKFHIGDILSITTGKILSPDGYSGMKEFLTFMTQYDDVYDSQVAKLCDICHPVLICAFPWSDIKTPDFEGKDKEVVMQWVNAQADLHGTYHEVEPLDFKVPFVDPVEELIRIRGSEEGIVIANFGE